MQKTAVEKPITYQPSEEGASELLNAVIFHIKNDYVSGIDETALVRNGLQYFAKNYAEKLSIVQKGTEMEVSCNGVTEKSKIPPNAIEEMMTAKYTARACLSAKAKMEFEFYDIAMAAALLHALPMPGHFYTKKEVQEWEKERRGDFASPGLDLRKEGSEVTIVRTLRDSPAEAAGIASGSLLNKVDGADITELSLIDIVRRLRGAAGTEVSVEIQTKQLSKLYKLTRKKIRYQPVDATLLPGKALVLYVKQLNPEAGDLVKKALAAAPPGIPAVIVDLRNSSGGLLEGIRSVTDPFVNGGVLFETRGRRKELDKQFSANPEVYLENKPVIVLTDENTSAGSEMVALVLQLRRGAKIYGRATRGKGDVGNVINLMYGNAMQLPIQEMYRSDGKAMRSAPVKPDVGIPTGEDALIRALHDLSLLKGGD